VEVVEVGTASGAETKLGMSILATMMPKITGEETEEELVNIRSIQIKTAHDIKDKIRGTAGNPILPRILSCFPLLWAFLPPLFQVKQYPLTDNERA